MKSNSHSAFGRGARSYRFTRSSGQDAAGLLRVVRISRPRTAPCKPICRINRAIVQRAAPDTLAAELPLHLAHAVDAEVRFKHPPDLGGEDQVAPGLPRQLGRVGAPGHVRAVGGSGDRQHTADRLGPKHLPMFIDKGDHRLKGQSSSAWAKYADALRRISLAWRTLRFSRSRALNRSPS